MRVGFIGYGNMADALACGFVSANMIKFTDLTMCNKSNVERREAFAKRGGVVAPDAVSVAKSSDVVFLAVKPPYIKSVLEEVYGGCDADELKPKVFVSVAAGVTLDVMEGVWTSKNATPPPMVRVMPNTPCLVGAAASGLCVGSTCSDDDRNKALALMSAVGVCKVIMESQMSALTGVSGSGPAYIFILIEAMADGGCSRRFTSRRRLTARRADVLRSGQNGARDGRTSRRFKGQSLLAGWDNNCSGA